MCLLFIALTNKRVMMRRERAIEKKRESEREKYYHRKSEVSQQLFRMGGRSWWCSAEIPFIVHVPTFFSVLGRGFLEFVYVSFSASPPCACTK